MSARSSLVGVRNQMCRPRRPGRTSAGSSDSSGTFVAHELLGQLQGGLDPMNVTAGKVVYFDLDGAGAGLSVPIGQWVLEEACRQAQRWQELFPSEPPRTMSVNLSGRQFAHPRLVDDIHRALAAFRELTR